jgi:hypothetical protein
VCETQSCIVSGDDVAKLFGSDVLRTIPELLQKGGNRRPQLHDFYCYCGETKADQKGEICSTNWPGKMHTEFW